MALPPFPFKQRTTAALRGEGRVRPCCIPGKSEDRVKGVQSLVQLCLERAQASWERPDRPVEAAGSEPKVLARSMVRRDTSPTLNLTFSIPREAYWQVLLALKPDKPPSLTRAPILGGGQSISQQCLETIELNRGEFNF